MEDLSQQDLLLAEELHIPLLLPPEYKLYVKGTWELGVDESSALARWLRNTLNGTYNRQAVLQALLRLALGAEALVKRCAIQLSDVWSSNNSRIFNIVHAPRERYVRVYHLLNAKLPLWLLSLQQVQRQYHGENETLSTVQKSLTRTFSKSKVDL